MNLSKLGQRPSRRGSSSSKAAAFWAARAIETALGIELNNADMRDFASREFVRLNGDDDSVIISMSEREASAWRTKERDGSMKKPEYFDKSVEEVKLKFVSILASDDPATAYGEAEQNYTVYLFDQRDFKGELVKSTRGRTVNTGYGPMSPKGKGKDTVEFIEFTEWTDAELNAAVEALRGCSEALGL